MRSSSFVLRASSLARSSGILDMNVVQIEVSFRFKKQSTVAHQTPMQMFWPDFTI